MTEETAELLEKADRTREAAEVLIAAGFYDMAAGRAYYAMFHTASALLLEEGNAFSKHSAVIAAYGRHFAKSGLLDPKYHRWLMDSQLTRLEADYAADAQITSGDARREIEHATEFLEAAKAYLAR
jgi:uncharacterized protein (UPF0332 family)